MWRSTRERDRGGSIAPLSPQLGLESSTRDDRHILMVVAEELHAECFTCRLAELGHRQPQFAIAPTRQHEGRLDRSRIGAEVHECATERKERTVEAAGLVWVTIAERLNQGNDIWERGWRPPR